MLKKQRGAQFNPDEYSFNVMWSEEDKAFIGRVLEFPSLAANGSTPEKALHEVCKVVAFVLEDLTAASEKIPAPLGRRE